MIEERDLGSEVQATYYEMGLTRGRNQRRQKFNKSPSCIRFWRSRYGGTIESPVNCPRRPHSHSNQLVEAKIKLHL